MYTKEEIQMGIDLCQMFIDLYQMITASIQEYLSVLEDAKITELRDLILKYDNVSTINQQKLIKKRYFNHEYREFIKLVSSNPSLLNSAITRIKKTISKKKEFEIFKSCGFSLDENFSLDAKYFFINYKVATNKIDELKAQLSIKL